jgi:hypothetical protein
MRGSLATLALLTSCDPWGTLTTPATSTDTGSTTVTACEGLDEATCGVTIGCYPLMGKPPPCPWTGAEIFAGCISSDGPPECADAVSSAGPPPGGDPEACWFFGSQCLPDGWTALGCPGPDLEDTGDCGF